ncbi:MAG: hypothetical protein CME64_00855 [Halobacteriovoraceae bacterium]|nr:hypothetical protein [Halobacteriovoraceae bacterium]MBG59471.1 hypothetical protein [Peredibacter sp.]
MKAQKEKGVGMSGGSYRPIEDYAIIGDCHSAALIGTNGSIDWTCFPRFDSHSVFARILDFKNGGFFQVGPAYSTNVSRSYLPKTNILLTRFKTSQGEALLTDFMPLFEEEEEEEEEGKGGFSRIVRVVEGVSGEVDFKLTLAPKFLYGKQGVSPQLLSGGYQVLFQHEKQGLRLLSDAAIKTKGIEAECFFTIKKNEKQTFLLEYFQEKSSIDNLETTDCDHMLEKTQTYFEQWSKKCPQQGKYRPHIIRSSLALKLLTYRPSGAFVAAPTTSLPEKIGGSRNWDYRYTWLRDASLTMEALFRSGHDKEAKEFLEWVCEKAKVGHQDLRIVYGLNGERDLKEKTLTHLEGYEKSAPVRIGNGAYLQKQLDTYGEILDSVDIARKMGIDKESHLWRDFHALVDWVCDNWTLPDKGIWEVRGEPRQFVHSKVMAWVALDRGICAVEELDLPAANLEKWKEERDKIYQEVNEKGWNEEVGAFTQSYGSSNLDAAALRMALVRFMPPTHPRIVSTVERITEELCQDGLVYRYKPEETDDGFKEPEAAFAICSFWLIENLALQGRQEEAQQLMDKNLNFLNDVGLLSEEIEVGTGKMLGNFPQAFSHIGVIRAAIALVNASMKGSRNPFNNSDFIT